MKSRNEPQSGLSRREKSRIGFQPFPQRSPQSLRRPQEGAWEVLPGGHVTNGCVWPSGLQDFIKM